MKIREWLLTGGLLVLPTSLVAQGPPSPQQMETERAALFDAADTDGDGKLSLDEFRTFEALVRHMMVQHFKEATGSGAVPPPFPTINPDEHFKQLDTNGDGAVTLDELQAERPRFRNGEPPQF